MKTRDTTCHLRRPRPRGFSFAEVMFAVIILGIGFIMVAAIFPVAIQQTKLTSDESTAAAVARGAASTVEQLAAGSDATMLSNGSRGPLFPVTVSGAGNPVVYSFRNPQFIGGLPTADLWNRAKGNFIDQTDPRFAWTALYSRGVTDTTTNTPAPFIRLYIFVVQNRERTLFDGNDLGDGSPAGTPVNLQPRMMRPVAFYSPGNGENDLVGFPSAQAPSAAEGAYIVVGQSAGNTYNGEIYRLGLERGPATGGPLNGSYVYELDPAYRLNLPTGSPPIAMFCWMVGRGLSDPTNPSSDFTGPAMDVTLYTTYVKVN